MKQIKTSEPILIGTVAGAFMIAFSDEEGTVHHFELSDTFPDRKKELFDTLTKYFGDRWKHPDIRKKE